MTFLRWAGSKKQLLETLSSYWHQAQATGGSGRYIEAFSGSAALFFRINPERAILIDSNESLQECLRVVQSNPLSVATLLRRFEPSSEKYYEVRALDDAHLTGIERAARFIYLNRHCFNGLYRTNRAGKFNVPYGKSNKSGNMPTETELLLASDSLGVAEIKVGDFDAVVRASAKKGDFLYMDPPYAKANERIRNQYGPNVFGTEDVHRLSALATYLDAMGVFFLISYAKCEEVKALASKWNSREVTVQRSIAASTSRRKKVAELLITNL